MGYSDHSAPPTNMLSDGLYVQVTAAYIQAGWSVKAAVAGWQAKSRWPVSVYFYPSMLQWWGGYPLNDYWAKQNSNFKQLFDDIPGLGGFRMEYSPNGLMNNAMIAYTCLRTINATATVQDGINDVVSKLYNNDPKVKEIYEYWYNDKLSLNEYTIKESFDIVDGMQDSWYKTLFKKFMVITAKKYNYPKIQANDPVFKAALDSYLSNVMACRNDGIIHALTICQRKEYNYMDLYPEQVWASPPYQAWYEFPVMPDDDTYNAQKAIFTAKATRSDNLDDPNLVILSGMKSSHPTINAPKNGQYIGVPSEIVFVGPGTLVVTPLDPSVVNEAAEITGTYPPGIHRLFLRSGGHTVAITSESGLMFLNGYYGLYRAYNVMQGHSYLWVPDSVAGNAAIVSANVAYLYDESGEFILYNRQGNSYIPPSGVGPGVVALSDTTTFHKIQFGNINPFLSQDPRVMLAPEALVKSEYPGLMKMVIV
jgi:hypothetical protein